MLKKSYIHPTIDDLEIDGSISLMLGSLPFDDPAEDGDSDIWEDDDDDLVAPQNFSVKYTEMTDPFEI